VHRSTLLCERLGRAAESTITAEDVAAAFFHRDGYLKKIGSDSEVIVYISKAGAGTEDVARQLAFALRTADTGSRNP